MAANIQDLDPKLDNLVKDITDAQGGEGEEQKLITVVLALFAFVPRLHNALKAWTKSVKDTAQVISEVIGKAHRQIGKNQNEIEVLKKAITLGKNNVSNEFKGVENEMNNMKWEMQKMAMTPNQSEMNDIKGAMQNMAVTVPQLTQEVVNIRATTTSPGGGHDQRGAKTDNILNNKAIYGLKTFQSDKAGFRMWNENLINALSR